MDKGKKYDDNYKIRAEKRKWISPLLSKLTQKQAHQIDMPGKETSLTRHFLFATWQ